MDGRIMKNIFKLYKIGNGPSSSHSLGPSYAASLFLKRLAQPPHHIRVDLYGSLAATGKGHLTDRALIEVFAPVPVKIGWHVDESLPLHPNGMEFLAFDEDNHQLDSWQVYSIGGGMLRDAKGEISLGPEHRYSLTSAKAILNWCQTEGKPVSQYIYTQEGDNVREFLDRIWSAMTSCVERGLKNSNQTLPGDLNLAVRAPTLLACAHSAVDFVRNLNLVSAYALAVAEENASGGTVVTAPTCGSAGVLPGVLYYFYKHHRMDLNRIFDGLATAAVFGSLVASRASISGAEVGCQGEIGTACAMAAAAVAEVLGGTVAQVEYAAEMGLEHWLGLTCDPVAGLVQIPCIERNAFAAMRAIECAAYSLATDGSHLVGFDEVVEVMNRTGRDLQSKYRETATGGLAQIMELRMPGKSNLAE
jgi:L-serine dehydratase